MRIFIGLYVVALGATALTGFAGGQAFDFSRFTIDSGGAMRIVGGNFELSGTVGQPDSAVLSGGDLTLTGGFWFETSPGDCNDDGATDLADLPSFEACMTGPDGMPAGGVCRCFDRDGSGSIDLFDFAEIQGLFRRQ